MGAKQLKEVLKSLLEEDSEEVYEFLSTSSSRTFHDIENEEEIQDKSTSEYSDTNNLKGKIQLPARGTRKTTRSSSRPSFQLPTRKGPTLSSVSPTIEENDSVSSSKKIKTSAKKYFQKVKSRLQTAAIWYVDNKDKTIEQIMGERWKQKGKCSGADSKEKRKSCVSAALADSEEDTPEAKQLKEVLKSLLEEDSEEVYEFLSTSSSRTFHDIENEEEIQDKLAEMPAKYEKLWEEDKSKTFSELESEFEREKTEKISELSNDMKAFFSKVGGQ